jgi:hypothetical protein
MDEQTKKKWNELSVCKKKVNGEMLLSPKTDYNYTGERNQKKIASTAYFGSNVIFCDALLNLNVLIIIFETTSILCKK